MKNKDEIQKCQIRKSFLLFSQVNGLASYRGFGDFSFISFVRIVIFFPVFQDIRGKIPEIFRKSQILEFQMKRTL